VVAGGFVGRMEATGSGLSSVNDEAGVGAMVALGLGAELAVGPLPLAAGFVVSSLAASPSGAALSPHAVTAMAKAAVPGNSRFMQGALMCHKRESDHPFAAPK
jgi:hypothetical protein